MTVAGVSNGCSACLIATIQDVIHSKRVQNMPHCYSSRAILLQTVAMQALLLRSKGQSTPNSRNARVIATTKAPNRSKGHKTLFLFPTILVFTTKKRIPKKSGIRFLYYLYFFSSSSSQHSTSPIYLARFSC